MRYLAFLVVAILLHGCNENPDDMTEFHKTYGSESADTGTLLTDVSNKIIVFGHQSVGNNILDGIATWEELNINATVLYDDAVEIWVSCWAVQDFHLPGSPPARGVVADYNWLYPIDPGGTGTGVGTPDNLILYCDGLAITVT